MKFANDLFDNTDPKLIKLAALNLGYEAGFRGFHITQENAKKYGCGIPWAPLDGSDQRLQPALHPERWGGGIRPQDEPRATR